MSKYLVQESSITPIADAIRSKTGTTETMTLAQMPELINGIQTGGGGFPNGTEWDIVASQYKARVDTIKYAAGVFVAYGSSAALNYGLWCSTDGITWEKTNVASGYFESVIYADGLRMWIANSHGNGIYYSPDGITWTLSDAVPVSGVLEYYNGVLLCHATVNNGTTAFLRSTDGKTWTNISSEFGSAYGVVGTGAGLFVGGYFSMGVGLKYSKDGITWTACSGISSAGSIDAIAYHNGTWVCVSSNKGIWYSNDGVVWSNVYTQGPGATLYSLCYTNGLWIMSGTVRMCYSYDGQSWAEIDMGDLSTLVCITCANGIWFGTSETSGLCYSHDGVMWFSTNLSSGEYSEVVYANGIYLVSSYATSNPDGVHYSTDGVTWESSNISNGRYPVSPVHVGNAWYVANDQVWRSVTWEV